MQFSRDRVAPILIAFGAAAALGAAGPLTGKFDNAVCQALSVTLSGGWPWVGFAFLVGYSRRSRIESMLLASSTLTVGVIVYYVLQFTYPDTPAGQVISSGSGREFSSKIMVWAIAALFLGGPVGFLGNIARLPGVGGLPFRLLIPLVAFIEASQRLTTEADTAPAEASWTIVRILSCVVALGIVGQTLWSWRSRRCRQANSSAEVSAQPDHP